MNDIEKIELKRKYKIKSIGGNSYSEGFFDCLKYMDDNFVFSPRPITTQKVRKR